MGKKAINRRDFLKVSGLTLGTAFVSAACGEIVTPTEQSGSPATPEINLAISAIFYSWFCCPFALY